MTKNLDDTNLLNPQEVSRILGVHQKTVHAWLRSGKLEGVKISYRAWRISKTALDQFIEKNRHTKPTLQGENEPIRKSSDILSVHDTPNDTKIPQKVNMKRYILDILGEQPESIRNHEE